MQIIRSESDILAFYACRTRQEVCNTITKLVGDYKSSQFRGVDKMNLCSIYKTLLEQEFHKFIDKFSSWDRRVLENRLREGVEFPTWLNFMRRSLFIRLKSKNFSVNLHDFDAYEFLFEIV